MGLFNSIINFLSRTDQRMNYGSLTFVGSTAVYPDQKAEVFVNQYSNSAALFSIVNAASKKFGVIPRYVYKIEDDKADKSYKSFRPVVNFEGVVHKGSIPAKKIQKKAYSEPVKDGSAGKLTTLLARPNPYSGQDLFFQLLYVYYKLTGEAFVWLNRDIPDNLPSDTDTTKYPVLEMYVLPSQFIEIIKDPENVFGIGGYMFNINGKRIPLNTTDVIHWRTANPEFNASTGEHLRGLSPLRAGRKTLSMEGDSSDAAVAMYQNGGARGVLFEKSLRNVSATQKSQIEDIVAKRISNKDMKSAVANLQGDWNYLDIGKDSVDLQLLEGNQQAWKSLCAVLGWQYELYQSDTTFANKEQAWKFATANIIIPDCCSLRDELNRVLVPAFGLTGYTIDIDYSALPELQENIKEMVDYLSKSPVTLNEFREAIGYDPIERPGMNEIWMQGSLQSLDEALVTDISTPNDNID